MPPLTFLLAQAADSEMNTTNFQDLLREPQTAPIWPSSTTFFLAIREETKITKCPHPSKPCGWSASGCILCSRSDERTCRALLHRLAARPPGQACPRYRGRS